MTTEEKLEKTSERVYARLTNSMLKQMADKYEELLKEKTSWEMDKKNEETEKDYPEYGAICINLDGCELSFPFNSGAKIEVVDGDDVYVTEVADTIDIKKIIGEILNAKNDIVGIRTFTTKEIEFYNKDKIYNYLKNNRNYNFNDTPSYLRDINHTVTTNNMYWTNRIIAALTDAHYNKANVPVEQYQIKVLAKSHEMINQFDKKFKEDGTYENLLKYYAGDEKPLRDNSNIWTTSLSFGVNCTKKSLTLRFWEQPNTVMKYQW